MPKSFNQENIPRLPERRDNTDVFCTYLMINTQNHQAVIQWHNYPRLRRNIQLYQTQDLALAQLFLQPYTIKNVVKYWRNIAINTSPILQEWEPKNRKELALNHLASYFEKKCYYAVKEVWEKSKDRPWEDYLSSARLFVYTTEHLVKLLRSYDERQATLDTYIQEILIKEIKNQQDVCRFSKWRLLVKSPDRDLQEALQRDGCPEIYIRQCIFARKYFQQVYIFRKINNPILRKPGKIWPEPDTEDFQQATDSYNAEKFLSSAPHEVSANSNITREELKKKMENCIIALQNYPKLNNPKLLEELSEKSQSKEINIDSEESDSETNTLSREAKFAFERKLARLKPDQHKILLLYYGANLKQKQLKIKLQVSQSAISRRLDTIKKQLLKTMIQKSQPHEWVRNYVVEWLHKDFHAPRHSDLIEAALVKATKELDSKDQQVLFLRYGEKVNEQNIATHLGISLLEVNAIIAVSQQKLQAHLIKELPHWEKKCVEEWLKSFYHSKISVACRTLNLSLEMEDSHQIIDKIVEECLRNLIITEKGE